MVQRSRPFCCRATASEPRCQARAVVPGLLWLMGELEPGSGKTSRRSSALGPERGRGTAPLMSIMGLEPEAGTSPPSRLPD